MVGMERGDGTVHLVTGIVEGVLERLMDRHGSREAGDYAM